MGKTFKFNRFDKNSSYDEFKNWKKQKQHEDDREENELEAIKEWQEREE
jgi:hypothetical protein